jgi:glutamate carboxypeptidase
LPSLQLSVVAGVKYGDHFVWSTRAPGPPILLIGHHDTVFPPGYFEGWSVEGTRAVGPGVLDMKGGLSLIWGVLATLEERGLLGALPLRVVSVADEEIGSTESRPHLERLAQGAACALVFESGRMNDGVVTQRKGTGTLSVNFEGLAAHAGNGHAKGINALWAMARFIDAAQSLTDYARGITVNVGLCQGGTSINTVPSAAECSLDIRFERSEDARGLLSALRVAAEQAAATVGAKVRIGGGTNRPPLERTAASASLYEEYAACAQAAGLGHAEHPLVGGGSDANTVAAVGVPAIDALGPRGDGFHTTSEWVELTSFLPKAQALLRFLSARALAGQPSVAPFASAPRSS